VTDPYIVVGRGSALGSVGGAVCLAARLSDVRRAVSRSHGSARRRQWQWHPTPPHPAGTATMRLQLLSAAILTAVPWSSSDKCGTDGCAEFPVFWWVWGANQTNLTAPFGMQPLARTQLGGHCSALTPIPKRIQRRTNTTSEWSQGAWPRSLPQNDTAAKLAAHIAALEAQLPHCIPDPEFDGNAIFDLEMWDPVWEMNNCTFLGNAIYPGAFDAGGVCMAPPSGVPGSGWRGQHQIDSIALVRSKHPDWPHAKLVAQAKHDFQAAAALFMIKTMETVKRIRYMPILCCAGQQLA
jgi:hypothetical protein